MGVADLRGVKVGCEGFDIVLSEGFLYFFCYDFYKVSLHKASRL